MTATEAGGKEDPAGATAQSLREGSQGGHGDLVAEVEVEVEVEVGAEAMKEGHVIINTTEEATAAVAEANLP